MTRTDAPICQDGRSRSQVCGLARSVVCHHALKDLAGEKAFETADDLPFGPPFRGASFDVVEGWCVEPHPHDDGPVERGVGTPRATPALPNSLPRLGIVKLRLTTVSDAQHGGFTTDSRAVSWGSID